MWNRFTFIWWPLQKANEVFKLWDLGAYPIFWQRQVKIRTVINDIQKLGIYPETWRYKLPTALWSIVGIQWYTMNPITNPRSGSSLYSKSGLPSSQHPLTQTWFSGFSDPMAAGFFRIQIGWCSSLFHFHGSNPPQPWLLQSRTRTRRVSETWHDRRSSEYSAMIQLVHLSPNTLWGSLRCIARN